MEGGPGGGDQGDKGGRGPGARGGGSDPRSTTQGREAPRHQQTGKLMLMILYDAILIIMKLFMLLLHLICNKTRHQYSTVSIFDIE